MSNEWQAPAAARRPTSSVRSETVVRDTFDRVDEYRVVCLLSFGLKLLKVDPGVGSDRGAETVLVGSRL